MSKYVKVKDRVKYGMGALDRGPYAILHSSAVLAAHPEIVSYCNTIRYHLLKDLSPAGPEHLSTARHVILSSCCRKLSKLLVIEEALTEDKLLAAGPLLDLWLALNKQIRDDLKLLGLDRASIDATPLTPDEMLLDAHADVVAQDAEIVKPGGDADA